jgi:O-antigen/teichoic acid export membrane protein
MSDAENTKRIAKNTLLLYLRLIFAAGIGFYTSRIVLNALGVIDYGIYNVVGGLVVMFSVVSSSLSSSASRFLAYELGGGDLDRVKDSFSASVTIHIILAIAVFILAETVGVWFLNARMNIPPERMEAANWVLQCSIFIFIIGLLCVPYDAVIIAHEHMKAFAYIGIIEMLLKLGGAFVLYWLSFDKLKVYVVTLLVVSLLLRIIYGMYCSRKFPEYKYRLTFEKSMFGKMIRFAGWNFVGVSSGIVAGQGVNIALNLFWGAALNAARGVSDQITGTVSKFTGTFAVALVPQITKSYASGNYRYMVRLIYQGTRFTSYLILFLALPVILETETVLALWLGMVPAHTVLFIRLIFILSVCGALSGLLDHAIYAQGNIKRFEIIRGVVNLLTFVFSYGLLYVGLFPQIIVVVSIVMSFFFLFFRLWYLRGMIDGFSVRYYLWRVVGNILLVLFLSSVFPFILHVSMSTGVVRFLLVGVACVVSTSVVVYYIGCSVGERNRVKCKILSYVNRRNGK